MTGEFESRFSQYFRDDLPPPLPRVLKGVLPRRRQKHGALEPPPERKLASDILPILTGPAMSDRTSSSDPARSGKLFQGLPNFLTCATSAVEVSAVTFEKVVLEDQQERLPPNIKGQRKGESSSWLVATGRHYQDTNGFEDPCGEPDGQETHVQTCKENQPRTTHKEKLKAKKGPKQRTTREKSLPDNVSRVTITDTGYLQASCVSEGIIGMQDSEAKQEHVYEEIKNYIDNETNNQIYQQIKAKKQTSGTLPKSLTGSSYENNFVFVNSIQDNIKVQSEGKDTQLTEKTLPPKKTPQRRDAICQQHEAEDGCRENSYKNPEVKTGSSNPIHPLDIVSEGDSVWSTPLCNCYNKNPDNTVNYYSGEVFEGSLKQQACSFSPPRNQRGRSSRTDEDRGKKNKRSVNASKTTGKDNSELQSSVISKKYRKKIFTSKIKPSFILSIKTPLGSLKVSGGKCSCTSQQRISTERQHNCRDDRRSHSMSPVVMRQRLSSPSGKPRQRRSLSPTPQTRPILHSFLPTHHKDGLRDEETSDQQHTLQPKDVSSHGTCSDLVLDREPCSVDRQNMPRYRK
ncbi:uncharacterized protein LOC121867967 [Homarus americanus]|nr:uncharacterized protein LOC121867967 [Homarus americanus]